MRILTLIVISIMTMGLVGIIICACDDPAPEFTKEQQEQLQRNRDRQTKDGVRYMSPEREAKSKLHLKYKLDTIEFLD